MSRHTSPTPPSLPYGQLYQAPTAVSSRQKSRAYTTGVAAGAEDVKYQSKYKELKRKVKEIEADNDKLFFKVLQAKRNIQRMRLERAILYERLSAIPPSPEMHGRHHPLPMPHAVPGQQTSSLVSVQMGPQPREHHDFPRPVDPNDPAYAEYIRTHENVRVIPGPDGRPIPIAEVTMGPGVAPPPHGLSPARHRSGSGHDAHRQLPPLPPLQQTHPIEGSRGHGVPPPNSRSHSGSSRSESRSHSSSRSRGQHDLPTPNLYTPNQSSPHMLQHQHDPLPLVHHNLQDPEDHEIDRRYEMHEPLNRHSGSQSPPPHLHMPTPSHPESLTPSPAHSRESVASRGSGRIHNHQRIGPGAHIHRMRPMRDSEQGRSQEWDRDHDRDASREPPSSSGRIPTPPFASRVRSEREFDAISRMREEAASPYGASGRLHHSRSVTPTGEDHSRPGSQPQLHERDLPRSYAARLDITNPDVDPQLRREMGSVDNRRPTTSEPRKRSHGEMELDDDNAPDGSRGVTDHRDHGPGGDDRRSKRPPPDGASPLHESEGRDDVDMDSTEA
ncbi:hypothetical protein JAAARDRAFT_187742 [Jaapia argillacea MUCL 33604]|uniref:INO80 complex subunit F domain-containing protein n=1 Tax=Jaapia argillacea MUCL 33604 TaxID=933084 RepID=A0A067QBS2_9AGAM|nr:hypothetical protein JAAARDRAFT_187742 [Jaapia argillacea MUCL 33604]